MAKALDSLFVVLLVTQVTSLFIAVKILGIPSSLVNLASISGLFVFIVFNFKRALKVVIEPNNLLFLSVCLFVPVYISLLDFAVFSGNFDLRLLGVRILLSLLYVSTIIFCLNNGLTSLKTPLIISIFIAFFGLLLSVVFPSLFLIFAEDYGAKSVTAGRAFGFYLQPNIAAASLCALFMALSCIRNSTPGMAISGLCFLGVAMTASRTGIVLFVLIYSCIYVYSSNRKFLQNTIMKMPKLFIAGVISVVGLAATVILYENIGEDTTRKFSASKRLTAILEVGDSSSISSVTTDSGHRVELANSYVSYIENNLIGHGLGATQRMTAEGIFYNSPHNQYIIVAFEFGILGLMLYLFWLSSIMLRSKRNCSLAIAISIFAFLLLYGFVSNTILSNRSIYIALAMYSVACMKKQVVSVGIKPLREVRR